MAFARAIAIPLILWNGVAAAMARKTIPSPQNKSGGSKGSHPNRNGPTKTLDDLTERNIAAIAELEAAADASRPASDRVADAITRFAGSMRFVYLHVIWFASWVAFNSVPFVPESWQIDKYPFTFLTFMVSLEAIFLSTFILISQNHEERMSEKRNHLDLQINLLSEQENCKMLLMLQAIHERLGIADDDPELEALEEATRPDNLSQQIDEIIENPRAN